MTTGLERHSVDLAILDSRVQVKVSINMLATGCNEGYI